MRANFFLQTFSCTKWSSVSSLRNGRHGRNRTRQSFNTCYQNISPFSTETNEKVKMTPKGPSHLATLRKKTGYSLSMCKQALQASDNDLDKAEQWIKDEALARGWDKANKLLHRNTSQGLIGVLHRGSVASMVEFNCETDFVARTENFQSLLNKICEVNLATFDSVAKDCVDISANENILGQVFHTDVELLLKQKMILREDNNKEVSLADTIASQIGQIGEKFDVKRAISFHTKEMNQKLSRKSYLKTFSHPNTATSNSSLLVTDPASSFSLGRYGVIMLLTNGSECRDVPEGGWPHWGSTSNLETIQNQLCQHIIGKSPSVIGNLDDCPSYHTTENNEQESLDKLEHLNDSVYEKESSDNEEGGEEMIETSKLETPPTLVMQPFLMDSDIRVGQLLKLTGLNIHSFARFELGENPQTSFE